MRTLRHGPMVALASVALVPTIGGPLRELHEHGVLGTYRRVRQVVFEARHAVTASSSSAFNGRPQPLTRSRYGLETPSVAS